MENKKYYFIGIGGIGMSGLAKILKDQGNIVSGSDSSRSPVTDQLKENGISVFIGQNKENVSDELDYIIFSSAITSNNPELLEAKKKGIKLMSRSELLGQLMRGKKEKIAIAGTHGKTTTSAMIALIFDNAKLDPSFSIGAMVPEFRSNSHNGKGDFFVAEACEYKNSFLDLFFNNLVITNVEEDHLDYFKTRERIIESFSSLTSKLTKEGVLVICTDSKGASEVLDKTDTDGLKVIKYGLYNEDVEWTARNVEENPGYTSFDLYRKDQLLDKVELGVPGVHNVFNSLAAIAVTTHLGVNLKTIKNTLSKFVGAQRRSELRGKKKGIIVIDDYGHHPTEIKATIEGVKKFYPERKIWCIFQPHQHSRTKFFIEDFARAFEGVDHVIIPDIYTVRDTKEDIESVSSADLADKIKKYNKDVNNIDSFDDVTNFLIKNVKSGELVLTMGAGPVYKVADMFLERLSKK